MSLILPGILFRSWYHLPSMLVSLRYDLIADSSEFSAHTVSPPGALGTDVEVSLDRTWN